MSSVTRGLTAGPVGSVQVAAAAVAATAAAAVAGTVSAKSRQAGKKRVRAGSVHGKCGNPTVGIEYYVINMYDYVVNMYDCKDLACEL